MAWDIWLIFFVLGVILPWRGRARLKTLLAMPRVGAMERIVLYASTIAFQWVIVAVVAWRAWVHGYTAGELGLTAHDGTRLAIGSIVGATTIATFHWFNLRRVGRMPHNSRGSIQAIAERILPQSTMELLPFLALAITAGLCEEFLYRGFAMAVLTRLGVVAWVAVLVSSILFGLAHLYQGRGGLVSTMLVGIVLGIGRVVYGSLVPVIFWHAAVDIVAGIAGPRYLLKASLNTVESTS
jgi:membrane protease YdiL (CAAX protease family)